jgi:uncharacterized protein (DUF58 family)
VTGWQPTHTLVRAAVASAALALVAVLAGRPDLLVLAAPFALHAVVAMVRRPAQVPHADSRLLHHTLREGEGTVLRTTLTGAGDVEHATVGLVDHAFMATRPESGVVGAAPDPAGHRLGGRSLVLDVPLASLRWGRRAVGDGLVAASGPWAGHQWGPHGIVASPLTTLPLPGRFDSRAPVPHPIGLVGTNPARRPGGGSEFASIRPFTPGDRLRRLQWRVSLRTGTLHVTSTLSEEDSSVLLVVDSGVEIGRSGGLHGSQSSLDVAVRAAGAIAEHHLSRGDRVGLRVLGSTQRNAVHTGAGRRHLRRILDTLAGIVPGETRTAGGPRLRFQVPAGAVVIVLSPMLSEHAVAATTTLAQRGLSVIVIDTLPEDVVLADEHDDPLRLAWRLRLLERDAMLSRLARSGVPVVAWRGPGTLDAVLRGLARRPVHGPVAAR